VDAGWDAPSKKVGIGIVILTMWAKSFYLNDNLFLGAPMQMKLRFWGVFMV
jgi:hypothetical protein